MLKLEALTAHLKNNGITAPITFNRRPEMPDELLNLVESPGMPAEIEDAFDNPEVQFTYRSPQDRPDLARDGAHRADRIMLKASLYPVNLGGYRWIACVRSGGGPAYLDIDEFNRGIYVCNYILTVQR